MWSRSYHNPVGTVYHAPSEADDRWATWDRKLSPAENPDPKEIPPRNYPLGYGLMNHMDTYGRRKPTIGLGAFLPRPMASQTPMGPPYVPMPGYSPYAGPSPQGSQILLPEGSLRLKGVSFNDFLFVKVMLQNLVCWPNWLSDDKKMINVAFLIPRW